MHEISGGHISSVIDIQLHDYMRLLMMFNLLLGVPLVFPCRSLAGYDGGRRRAGVVDLAI